jgi:hypothetical protein
MAKVTYYVNTASSGGDGSTNETSGATAAFSSVDTALKTISDDCSGITAENVVANGYTFDNVAVDIICDNAGGLDTTASTGEIQLNSCGITNASASKRVLVRASDSCWHTNLQPETGYTIKFACDTGWAIIASNNTSLTRGAFCMAGICLSQTNTGSSRNALVCNDGSDSGATDRNTYVSCIFVNAGADHAVDVASAPAMFFNCRFEAASSYGLNVGSSGHQTWVINCLSINNNNNGYICSTSSDATVKWVNNVGFNNTGDDYSTTNEFSEANYNASEDTTANNYGANYVTGITSAAFTNTGSDNYIPVASGALDGVGQDQVTNGLVSSRVDANGNTRPTGDTWAIGPLESVGGASVAPLAMYHYQHNTG